MDPMTLYLLASTAISAGSQIMGGMAAKAEADAAAFDTEIERTQNEVSAMQQAAARRDEYDMATQANIAMFSAAGRDIGSDRSIEAFLSKQKEVAAQDIGRIADQTAAQSSAYKRRSSSQRTAGENARTSSLISAAGTAASGLYKYERVKAGI